MKSPKFKLLILFSLSFFSGISLYKFNIEKLNISRLPSYFNSTINFQKYGESCREDWQCESQLLCRNKVCLDVRDKLTYGESCSVGEQCESNFCDFGKCGVGQQTTPIGVQCQYNSECRSGMCDSFQNNKVCFSTSRLQGFSGDPCSSPSSCISNRCSNSTCQQSGNSLSCASIGTSVKSVSECCSGQADPSNLGTYTCTAVNDSICSRQGYCRGRVGRFCAPLNSFVKYESQCCSERAVFINSYQKKCSPRIDQLPSACLNDSECSTNQICDKKEQVCKYRN